MKEAPPHCESYQVHIAKRPIMNILKQAPGIEPGTTIQWICCLHFPVCLQIWQTHHAPMYMFLTKAVRGKSGTMERKRTGGNQPVLMQPIYTAHACKHACMHSCTYALMRAHARKHTAGQTDTEPGGEEEGGAWAGSTGKRERRPKQGEVY
jgi:hypothetical protein